MAAKKLAHLMNSAGLSGLRAKLKTSPLVRNILYRPFGDKERPKMPPETEARLRELMEPEIRKLDRVAGTDFARLWKYG